MKPTLTPEVTTETMDPMDLVSALQTAPKARSMTCCLLRPNGTGYETFLRWALEEISAGRTAQPGDSRDRFCANALMNARRALACLMDQYLIRDGFAFCKDAPREASDNTRILVRRGVLDDLAADALRRAIERRHAVEHQYQIPRLADAEDTVQVVRATIETAVARSDPHASPTLFGHFLGGTGSGPQGTQHWFHGWSGTLIALVVFSPEPWLGVLIPSTEVKATLRKVALKDLSCRQLLDAWEILDQIRGPGHWGTDPSTLEGELRNAGLWE